MSEATTASLDMDRLLQPISAEQPSGASLRYDPLYDRIREARRRDDPSLEQGIWQTQLKMADWRLVRNLCVEALETRTKDLQIAAWFLEALIHSEGFSGARQGLDLVNRLCQDHWDTLFPAIDGEDLEARVAPIEWIDQKLSLEIKRIPVTEPTIEDAAPLSWADWQAGFLLENAAQKSPDVMKEALTEGKVTQAQFITSCTLTPKSHFIGVREEIARGLELTATLGNFLDEKCGILSPSLVQLRNALSGVNDLVADILAKREDEGEEDEGEGEPLALVETGEAGEVVGQHEETVSPPPSDSHIRTRDEAYRALSQAADYLLRTEPHSPTPYLVKRAVAWGRLPLEGLLTEIVRNDTEREELFRLLRIGGAGEPTDT